MKDTISYYLLVADIVKCMEGLYPVEGMSREELETNVWRLVRTHMNVYAQLVGAGNPSAAALAYFMENDKRIPEDDIDTDGEWDELAAINDAYVESLHAVQSLLVAAM